MDETERKRREECECYAIIAAAGSGTRMESDGGKQMLLLREKAVVRRSCEIFEAHPSIGAYLVLGHPMELKAMTELLEDLRGGKLLAVIPGGESRQESVLLGLRFFERHFTNQGVERRRIMLIHDGARCLLTGELISRCLDLIVDEHCASGAAVSLTDTVRILRNDGRIDSTPPRANTVAMQTPQGADFSVLLAASEEAWRQKLEMTDDLQALEAIGYPIRLTEGERENIKLTRPEDLALAEYYLARRFSSFCP